MPFKENNKLGGRKAGAKNKTSEAIRKHFQTLISNNLEQLDKDIKQLEPLQRIKAIIELSKLTIGTLKAIELTKPQEEFKPINIHFTSDKDIKRIINDVESKY